MNRKTQIGISISSVMPFLFGTLLTFTGCTTMQSYEGPKLSPEKVALLKGSFGMINSATILEVDGKRRGFTQETAEILPGEHTVKIQVQSGFGGIFSPQYVSNKTLSFLASAGHTYQADGVIKNGDPFAWIIDETTKEVVAGGKP